MPTGRVADRLGPARAAAVWFALTAVGTCLPGVRMPSAVTFVVAGGSTTENRAEALGRPAGQAASPPS
ncbi:hypothetical protein ACFYYN_38445 [Streptomyces sp. NPDC001902]